MLFITAIVHSLSRTLGMREPRDFSRSLVLKLSQQPVQVLHSRWVSATTLLHARTVIEHVRTIAAATDLPVSADLENGFGDAPKTVEETIRLAAEAGVVGGSIEDSTGRPNDPIYDIDFAVERIRAAVAAARSVAYPFMLTARAENYLHKRPDLGDTIRRLQAFQEAGADVLYAPGLMNRSDIADVVRSVDRPVNVLMGMQGIHLTLADLSQLGVKRVSTGGALSRAAFGAVHRAAVEMRDQGTFHFVDSAMSSRDLNGMFEGK